MNGNVWEVVWDWYANFESGAVLDPRGPEDGDAKVLKGGSWAYEDHRMEPGKRYSINPVGRSRDVGFRVARNL
jgi:formylglycine-generating enzyme required for sulfatase activity